MIYYFYYPVLKDYDSTSPVAEIESKKRKKEKGQGVVELNPL
jgi:hypothetical protein